jgi:hypothetical protein
MLNYPGRKFEKFEARAVRTPQSYLKPKGWGSAIPILTPGQPKRIYHAKYSWNVHRVGNRYQGILPNLDTALNLSSLVSLACLS